MKTCSFGFRFIIINGTARQIMRIFEVNMKPEYKRMFTVSLCLYLRKAE